MVGEFGSGQRADQDGRDRRALDHAVGAHEVILGNEFGQDAVFGRAVERRPDADDRISDQRLQPRQDQQCPGGLERVGRHEDLRLWKAVGRRANPWCARDKSDQKHALQCRNVPGGRIPGFQHDRDDDEQDGIVGKRRQELRDDQRQQVAVHESRNSGRYPCSAG